MSTYTHWDRIYVITAKHGLIAWARFKMKLTRTANVTQHLKTASKYTGKTYRRGDAAIAAKDLDVWLANNPIVENGRDPYSL